MHVPHHVRPNAMARPHAHTANLPTPLRRCTALARTGGCVSGQLGPMNCVNCCAHRESAEAAAPRWDESYCGSARAVRAGRHAA